MKKTWCLAIVIAVLLPAAMPEQASAQLFRRPQEDNQRNSNLSSLPGVNTAATRVADYGANQVSEEIRNEVNGRAPVRPAPDFRSNAPLAAAARQYRYPNTYRVQRPNQSESSTRVQPPPTPHAHRLAALPHWLAPYDAILKLEVQSEELAPSLEFPF